MPLPEKKIRKAVSTLAVVPKAGGSISRLARQAYSVMLMLAKEQTLANGSQTVFKVPLNSVIRGYGGTTDSKATVKTQVKSMISTIVEWQSPTDGEASDWEACGLISWVKLSEEGGQTMLSWSYAQPFLDELMNPQIYAQLQRSTVGKFRSHHGLALYEICARYQNNPSHKTSKNTWRWWQPVLTGKPKKEDSKTEYRFFKRDTLMPAVNEVNAVSELNIEMLETKNGKVVEFIQFEVHKKPEVVDVGAASGGPVEASALVKAEELGIPSSTADEMWEKHGNEKLLSALNSLASRLTQITAPVRSRVAYLRVILANKAEVAPVVVKADTEAVVPQQTPPVPVNPAELQLQKTQSTDAEKLKVIRSEIDALSDADRSSLLEEFRQYAVDRAMHTRILEKLSEGRWALPMVFGNLAAFYWKKTRGSSWSADLA